MVRTFRVERCNTIHTQDTRLAPASPASLSTSFLWTVSGTKLAFFLEARLMSLEKVLVMFVRSRSSQCVHMPWAFIGCVDVKNLTFSSLFSVAAATVVLGLETKA